MEMIKAQLLRIQQQLAGLSATQKMLTASLVAIMLITLVWWSKSAGTSDLEPVVAASMSPEEAAHALDALHRNGITEASLSNGQVLVPSARKSDAVAMLAYSDAMPNQANAADELLKLIGPFDSNAKIQLTKDATLQARLEQSFITYFPGVQKAMVVLNSNSEHRIGGSAEPSASVMITTKKGLGNPRLLTASITNIVSKAVSGLQPNKVAVAIDGKRMQSDGDSLDSDESDTRVITLEGHYTDKIREIVPPDSMVLVKVELDDTTTHTETHAGNPETTVSKEARSESQTSESQTAAAPSGEPGAVPNASVVIPGGNSAGAQTSMSTEKTQSENTVYIGRTETLSDKQRGVPHLRSAAVRVPMSTLLSWYKIRHPKASDPSDEELEPFIKSQLAALTDSVVHGLNLSSDKGVAMSVYFDAPPATPVAAEMASIAPTSMVSGYGKQVMLGVLAAISLFMVATMVKKGIPAPAVPIATSPVLERGPFALNGIGELAGIVNDESSGTLDGVEVDEQQLKNHRVVEQVSALVKDDPDAAAQLIKRWMSPT